MSTNYYLQRETMPQRWGPALEFIDFSATDNGGEYALHLGHTAGGWYTLFQKTPLYSTFAELIAECEQSIAEGAHIKDEYGTIFTVEEFKEKVLAYEKMERTDTVQQGVKLSSPISHMEYLRKVSSRYAYDYYADGEGKEFCTSEFS